jgi:VWFA-related protein
MGMGSRWILRGLQIASCVCCVAVASSGRWVGPFQQQDQSQSQTQPPIFRAEHNEVEVVVTVRDRNGESISNLTQSEFTIRDNGKVQTISAFALQGATQRSATPQPTPTPSTEATSASLQTYPRRFVALFFDDTHTEPGDFARVQKAARQFVQESLGPEDRVAIFKASENGEVTFTNDKPKLLAAIDALRVHPATNTSTVTQCPRITNYEAYLIANNLDPEALNIVTERLLDCTCPPPRTTGCPQLDDLKPMARGDSEQIWQSQENASRRLLAALDLTVGVLGTAPGRRMLVLSSSGFLSGNLERDVNRVIDHALRREVAINALNAKGLYAETPGGTLSEQRLEGTSSVSPQASRCEARQFSARLDAENESMIDFAESTGGKFFNNNNDFLHGLNELAAPEVSYVLAFSPHPLKHDGKFHNLKVEIKTAGHLSLYARKGYFAPTDKEFRQAARTQASTSQGVTADTKIPAPPGSKAPAPTPSAADLAAAKPSSEASGQPASAISTVASPQLPPNTTAANISPASNQANAPPADAAQIASEQEFLNRASREVQHYIEAFADLTADETRIMQSFDDHGLAAEKRSIQSALVVYRLRKDPKDVVEFREVISIDGHEVKGHAARAAKLWREVAEAHSPQEEVRRITSDSERYDVGLAETGFTLFEGLPLRSRCTGVFLFREVRTEMASERPVRVFAYRQVRPCEAVAYRFALPRQFADSPLLHAGEMALDAATGQIVREERNVYAGNPGKKAPRVAHMILSYDASPFGILVPKTLVMETFLPREGVNGMSMGFQRYARMVQTYGPFSRFEVSTGQRISAPGR